MTFDKKENKITFIGDDDYKLNALKDILATRMAKRGVSLKSLKFGEVEQAFEGTLRQVAEITMGIPKDRAKELVDMIKKLGVKVQTQIEGEKIKVSSPKKDDLQIVIAHLRTVDFVIPISFCNYR